MIKMMNQQHQDQDNIAKVVDFIFVGIFICMCICTPCTLLTLHLSHQESYHMSMYIIEIYSAIRVSLWCSVVCVSLHFSYIYKLLLLTFDNPNILFNVALHLCRCGCGWGGIYNIWCIESFFILFKGIHPKAKEKMITYVHNPKSSRHKHDPASYGYDYHSKIKNSVF